METFTSPVDHNAAANLPHINLSLVMKFLQAYKDR